MQIKDNNIVLSVSEYLERLNVALSGEAGFVEGEVIGFKESSQWVFFSLQDTGDEARQGSAGSLPRQGAVLSCGLLAHEYLRIGVRVEDGMKVKIFGNPRITPKSGRFGMWVKSIEPVGEGSLKKAYELLLKKLKNEGLFERKRELPEFITRIGVISSREGVVLQDLRNNLRNLGIKISFVHAQVEGVDAVPGLLRALQYFAKNYYNDYDCVVIIRGGGSLESLQAFNNEEVARAIYAMPVPVIAGIGHDVDVPIAALVADVEASTPTAVAHIINSTWDSLALGLPIIIREIENSMDFALHRSKENIIRRFSQMTGFIEKLKTNYERLIATFKRGIARIDNEFARIRESISRISKLLDLANPLRNLSLGYSISTNSQGKVLRSVKRIKKGEIIETRLSDGKIESEVI